MRQHSPLFARVTLEPLEGRRLLAGEPWGALPQLIRQDVAQQTFPSITGAGQTIAVIDTGIDYTQPALGGGFGPAFKVWGGWDFVDNDPDPMDSFGHGTNVAGVIAANPFVFDGQRFSGIAPDARLVALRVDAGDDPVPPERIEQALRWVIDNKDTYHISVVNISFGEGHYSGDQFSLYSTELRELHNDGIFVCAASGNDGVYEPFGIQYPAADPNVFSVGAVDKFDRITEYSARGPNLDYLAPGDSVATTSEGPNSYEYVSGTSFATPAVAGAVALIKQANSWLQVKDVEDVLHISGVDNIDGDNEFGAVTHLTFPRLDLANAISLAAGLQPGPLSDTGEIAPTTDAAMTYDASGVLHVVYYDPAARTLKYAARLNNKLLSNPRQIDFSGDDVGQYVSLALDNRGRPAAAYFDGTTGDLKYAHFNGASWDVRTLDSRGSVGLYPSLAFDSAGHANISYYQKTKGDLRIAQFDGTSWTIHTIDGAGDVGRSTSLAIDSGTGEIAIGYEHSGLGVLKVARNAGAGWTLSAPDMATRGVSFISLAFTQNHQPAVSYYNAGPSDLKYTTFDGSKWQTQALATKGAQGLYTQLYFTGSQANILYYSRRSDSLMKLTNTASGWVAAVLQTSGGKYVALAHPTDNITYGWFRNADGKMLIADL